MLTITKLIQMMLQIIYAAFCVFTYLHVFLCVWKRESKMLVINLSVYVENVIMELHCNFEVF